MNTQTQTPDKSDTPQDQLWTGMDPERLASYREDVHSGIFRPGDLRTVFLGTLSGLLTALLVFLAAESYHAFAQPPPQQGQVALQKDCAPAPAQDIPLPEPLYRQNQTEGFFDGIHDI